MAGQLRGGLCGFSGGGVTAPAPTVTSLEIMPAYGQSENRRKVDPVLADLILAGQSAQAYVLDGMRTVAGTAIGVNGAGTTAIDQNVPATGLAGFTSPDVAPSFTALMARAARWRDAGQGQRGVIIGDNGFGGQLIDAWDINNPTNPVGRNQLYWMREAKRLADSMQIGLSCPYVWLFQGTSAKDDPGADYRARFDTAHGQTLAQAESLFGARPRLIVVVNGGDVNTIGDLYATPATQYRIGLDYDGIIATWQRAYPIEDRNIHINGQAQLLIGETAEWAMAETEAGHAWNITYQVVKSGAQVIVGFDLRPGETLLNRAGLYDSFGGAATCPHYGFEADGGIVGVQPDLQGDSVTITLANPAAGWLRFAHQVQDCAAMADAAGMTMSAHRTTLFGSHSRASRYLPGETLWRSLPGFRGTFQGDIFRPEDGT